jgi:hypothetical protein
MKPETRLILCVTVVLASAVYAALVAIDKQLASTVGIGYVAVLLTALVAIHIGKKTHERNPRA